MTTLDIVAMLLAHSGRAQRHDNDIVTITLRCGYQLGVRMRIR